MAVPENQTMFFFVFDLRVSNTIGVMVWKKHTEIFFLCLPENRL